MNALRTLGFVLATGAAAGFAAAQEEGAAAPSTMPLARLEVDTRLQVFPTDISPHFGDELAAGSVVAVGRIEGEFREVVLPLGVRGFVHKKFTTAPVEGRVSAESKLAFRYRPRTGEAPVAFVDQGVSFRVAGEEGEWWVVRHADGTAWVPESSVVVFEEGAANPTLAAAWAELARQHAQACEDFFESVEERRALAAASEARHARLGELRAQFQGEMSKPVAEQSYAGLRSDVDDLITEGEGDEPFVTAATRFRDRIDMQATIVEATMITNAEPKPAQVDVPLPVGIDPLARFDAIGWVEVVKSWNGEVKFKLTKGGQVLHELQCTSGRYDLTKFSGLEVGMIGPKERPSLESMRVLDVERIEVLRAK